MAVDAQRGLEPPVVIAGLVVIVDLEIADARIEAEIAPGDLALRGDLRRDRPVLDRLPQQLEAATIFIDRVIVVLRDGGVAQRVRGGRVVIAQIIDRRRPVVELPLVVDVIDIAAVAPVIAHGADRHRVPHRHVDIGLALPAEIAGAIFIGFEIIAELVLAELGLVGDQANRARQRAGAVERALRSGQRLDALQIIGMDIGNLGAGDGDVVQIETDRCISAASRHDAAEKRRVAARTDAFEGDRGKQGGEIAEPLHLALLQRIGAQRLHRDRHLLDALRAARRRHDDVAKATLGFVRRRCHRGLLFAGGLIRRQSHTRTGEAGQYRAQPQGPHETRPTTRLHFHTA